MNGVLTPTAAASDPLLSPLITYRLYIRLAHALSGLVVGRLGVFDLPAGDYCYTGSARRNLEARLRRHLSRDKTLRWHIDYLLLAPGVSVWRVERSGIGECLLNQQTVGTLPIPGFGASDCRAGCGSHLKYLGCTADEPLTDSKAITGFASPPRGS